MTRFTSASSPAAAGPALPGNTAPVTAPAPPPRAADSPSVRPTLRDRGASAAIFCPTCPVTAPADSPAASPRPVVVALLTRPAGAPPPRIVSSIPGRTLEAPKVTPAVAPATTRARASAVFSACALASASETPDFTSFVNSFLNTSS